MLVYPDWGLRGRSLGGSPGALRGARFGQNRGGPPYGLYTENQEGILDLISQLVARAPDGSLFAVEASDDFDFGLLTHPEQWDVRAYLPAVVGVLTVKQPIR